MQTIVVLSQKGGTGKTTSAVTLADGLARKGRRVLCIDINEQADLSDTLGITGDVAGSMELFTGTAAFKLIRHTNIENVDIIPGSAALATLEGKIPQDKKGRAFLLRDALKPINGKYSYCIVDAPGSFNTALLNALSAADTLIITAQADYYSLKGIGRLIDNIRYVKSALNPALYVAGILITRYNGRRNVSKAAIEALEAARESLGTKVFKAKIRESAKITEAPGNRKTVLRHAPGSNGAADYMEFINEFLGGK